MVSNYMPVWIFFVITVLLLVATLVIAAFLRPREKKGPPDKQESYECGELPEGIAWIRFHAGYYLVALIFILFDVEAVFLFPWALTLKKLGVIAFVEMLIFILILLIGWVYAYRKGDFEWK